MEHWEFAFINDLPLHIENSDCDMYADDSSVTSTTATANDLDFKKADWRYDIGVRVVYRDNHMLPNASKTKAMLITTWQKGASLPEQYRILKVTQSIPTR